MRGWRILLVAAAAAFAALAAIAVPVATPVAMSQAAQEYVINGGFEDGAAPWAASAHATIEAVNGDVVAPYEGAMSGRMTLIDSSATIRQTARDLPPGDYRFVARVRVARTGTGARFSLAASSPTFYSEAFDVPASPDG